MNIINGLLRSDPNVFCLTNRLAIEIVPAIIFIAIWIYTESSIYLIVLIAMLVIYNVQRVLRQYKNIVKLNLISKKTIGESTDETET